ncbi:MAG TPA: divergent polysaccharide deacetylase family protein [Planctomycetaceae bacterium]|nr:divergent polysaccharide deacetylase family protein [Planctomycetaceae bacterium]
MDERSQEETQQERTGLDSLLSRLYQPGPLVFFFTVIFLGLLALGYFLLTEETPPPKVVADTTIVESPTPAPRIYEEDTSSHLEDIVKKVDLSIIQTMRDMGLEMNKLELLDVEIRRHENEGYHYQVLQMPPMNDYDVFRKNLKARMAQRECTAEVESEADHELLISIAGVPTHRILLKTIPMALPTPEHKGPKLAIVIDDIGENLTVLNGLINLDFPVTYAVWPHATHTRKSVKIILEKRQDLIIHFPMEPKGYPRYNPGEDALFVDMTADAIRKQVAANIAQVPEAIGVNNHMGSRFTGYAAGMKVALEEFNKQGLFFLDSLTTGKSVARQTAANVGISFYERDIFIDNVKDVNAIVHQLKKAENVAMKEGYSIAIGHPYKETVDALEKWSKNRNNSIQLIPLSSLKPE